MDNGNVIESLGQADFGSAGEIFRDYVRTATQGIVLDVMTEELLRLCGPRYRPDADSEFSRAGTADGYIYIEADREQITRPRVRHKNPDGTTSEVPLESYTAAQDRGELRRQILASILAAGSQSKTGKLLKNKRGSSASTISRMFQQHGRELFAKLRRRRLDCDENGECYDWLGLMVDGVVLSKDITAIVAVGITTHGDKIVLDFEIGASENLEVASALINRAKRRGFAPPEGRPLLAVLDGSDPQIHLPKNWSAVVQQAAIHVIALAHYPWFIPARGLPTAGLPVSAFRQKLTNWSTRLLHCKKSFGLAAKIEKGAGWSIEKGTTLPRQ